MIIQEMGLCMDLIHLELMDHLFKQDLMSMESVFAVVCAALILGEMMTPKELIGCIIMFAAVIIVQMPSKEERLAAKAQ